MVGDLLKDVLGGSKGSSIERLPRWSIEEMCIINRIFRTFFPLSCFKRLRGVVTPAGSRVYLPPLLKPQAVIKTSNMFAWNVNKYCTATVNSTVHT
jgi:hypothetical protein